MNISKYYIAVKRRLRRSLHIKARKNSDALRWGIIGLGNMAQVFADALNGNSESVLVAVASRSSAKADIFAKRNGVGKAYGSYEEMLADDELKLDVVYVATPVKYHFEHVKQCLLSGKNVLCEKPATYSSVELLELISLAEQNNCFLMEGMWMKCLPTFVQAKKWLLDGKIGELELIRTDFYKREHIRPDLAIFNPNEGGGVIHDFGIYAIAYVEAFMGMPSEIKCHSKKSPYGLDSDWHIYMKKGHVEAYVNMSSVFSSSSKAVLIGDKGSIEFGSQFNRTNMVSLFAKDGTLVEIKRFEYEFDGFEYEIRHVKQMIRAGRKQSDLVLLSDSYNVLSIIDQLSYDE